MPNQKNYDLVDLFKFIFSILIIGIHTNAMGFNILGRLGVPFFFMISSYFFFKKYLTKNTKDQYQQLKNYLKRLFFLFLSWQIIYLPNAIQLSIRNYHGLNGNNHPIITILYMLLRFIICGDYDGWKPSWYLFASFYGILFICILRKNIPDWILLFLGLSLQIFFIVKFNIFNLSTSWYDFTFLRSILYIMIGLYLAKYPKILSSIQNKYSKKTIISTSCICIFLYFLEYISLYKFFDITIMKELGFLNDLSAIMIVITALSIKIYIPYAKIYREMSTFIFCVHGSQMIFIRILYLLFHFKLPTFGYNYIEFIIITLLSILCFFIYKIITKKFNNQKWLKYFV